MTQTQVLASPNSQIAKISAHFESDALYFPNWEQVCTHENYSKVDRQVRCIHGSKTIAVQCMSKLPSAELKPAQRIGNVLYNGISETVRRTRE